MDIARNRNLGAACTLGVGGSADYYAEAHDVDDVRSAVGYAENLGIPLLVLGGGSNVVIADRGVRALALKMSLKGITHFRDQARIELHANAGETWDELVELSVRHNWAGLECLSGIPGQVGATPIQNVGAYGQEVSDTIRSVRAFDRKQQQLVEMSGAECRFEYRNSLFKKTEPNRYIILSVSYELRLDQAPTVEYAELRSALSHYPSPSLEQVRATVIALRKKKSMVLSANDPNGRSCGSFFLNPLVTAAELEAIARLTHPAAPPHFIQADGRYKLPAAWLIERAGFEKGTQRGTIGLSTRHTLAIVCHDGATTADVVRFAHEIRKTVADRFGVRLSPEPSFLGFERFDDGLPLLED